MTGRGPYSQTFTGGAWYSFEPRVEDVRFADLRALARINRYGGHTICDGYSVAEHSVRVAWLLEEWDAAPIVCLAGLLHDAHEAYPPGDQIGPILRAMKTPEACAKLSLPPGAFDGLLALEAMAKRVTREAFGVLDCFIVGLESAAQIHHADMTLLATERRDLMAPEGVDWGELLPPLPRKIKPWAPHTAWETFEQAFDRFGGAIR